MKKILFLFLVLITVLSVVACGDEASTTTEAEATTSTLPVTTVVTTDAVSDTKTPETSAVTETTQTPTTVAVTTTESGSHETPPEDLGVDILNGDPENRAINPTWKGTDAIAFENHHSVLDFNVALVMLMTDSENAIYQDLIMTQEGEEGNDAWELNQDYKWVVTVDGTDYEIKRFSIYHQVTKGYVRMDLGSEFQFSEDVDDKGVHAYDVWLRIYDVKTDAVAYYAWFTDPEWNGAYEFVAPKATQLVPDANRDPSHVAAEGATAFSGPVGYTGELYGNLFDGNVESKLCTGDLTTPIVWKYAEAVEIVSYSLVGARDDATYKSRVLTKWKFYGSSDGTKWDLLDEQTLETPETVTNYGERNFKLEAAATYLYFKLEPVDAAKYQLSELIVYTKAE